MKEYTLVSGYVISLVMTALLLNGCSPATEVVQTEPDIAQSVELVSGVDVPGMNLEVRPQDDYNQYANGAWFEATEIPADEVGWGGFFTARKEALTQSRAIVESLAATESDRLEDQQLGDYYKSWMNEARVGELGLKPLADDLASIDKLNTHAEVGAFIGKVNPMGVDGPINFYIGRDRKDSTRYSVVTFESGLGLPDRDYYFDESDRGKFLRAEYTNYLARLLMLAGFADSEDQATNVVALETQLAEHQWDKVTNRDADKTYNPMSSAQLAAMLSNMNPEGWFAGIGLSPQELLTVKQPSYFVALNTLFTQVPVSTWKSYLRVRLLSSFANFLSEEFVSAHFDFYSKTLYGRQEQTPRWRRAIGSINGNLGELLGKLYVERHFSPESKTRVAEMVNNLIAAYSESIKKLDWMSDETKEKALLKLSKFTPKIGYPDKWKSYASLEVKADDLVGNIKRSRSYLHFYDVAKLGQPIDKTEWLMAPQEVNAYYYASANEIVFPAAYLQPPSFIPEAEDAYNYGAIGATIGHEIGHGFDDQGSKYDGDGNLVMWWTDEDRAHFEEKTRGLVAQYNQFEALPGLFVNGELTLGENIGDLGGTAIALKAYRMSLKGKVPPVIDGFTADERFFLGNAQSNRTKWRSEILEVSVKSDPHAPDEFRINGVLRNMDDFYQTYGLKEGDGLYLPSDARVRIWQ